MPGGAQQGDDVNQETDGIRKSKHLGGQRSSPHSHTHPSIICIVTFPFTCTPNPLTMQTPEHTSLQIHARRMSG